MFSFFLYIGIATAETIPADTEPGKYTVEFTGTSGLLSDSTSIKIVVVS